MELVTQAVSALLKVELQAAIVLLGELQSLDFDISFWNGLDKNKHFL